MQTYPLKLELVIEETPRRVQKVDGSFDVRNVLDIVQDDTAALASLLEGIDTAKPEYRKKRRFVRGLKKEMRKHLRKSESINKKGTYEIGEVQLTGDAADFVLGIIKDPPEHTYRFIGATSDTLVELEDKLTPIKEVWEADGAEEDPEVNEAPEAHTPK